MLIERSSNYWLFNIKQDFVYFSLNEPYITVRLLFRWEVEEIPRENEEIILLFRLSIINKCHIQVKFAQNITCFFYEICQRKCWNVSKDRKRKRKVNWHAVRNIAIGQMHLEFFEWFFFHLFQYLIESCIHILIVYNTKFNAVLIIDFNYPSTCVSWDSFQ